MRKKWTDAENAQASVVYRARADGQDIRIVTERLTRDIRPYGLLVGAVDPWPLVVWGWDYDLQTITDFGFRNTLRSLEIIPPVTSKIPSDLQVAVSISSRPAYYPYFQEWAQLDFKPSWDRDVRSYDRNDFDEAGARIRETRFEGIEEIVKAKAAQDLADQELKDHLRKVLEAVKTPQKASGRVPLFVNPYDEHTE
jgi:hypothetical protein